MGYTTKFSGRFDFNKLPTAEVIVRLNEIADDPKTADGNPGSYCQWALTKDCMHLEWDRGEKFYNYVEWLQYLIDTVLKPADIQLSGSVGYSGEIASDIGIITVENNIARSVESKLVGDELAELQAFRDFVLSHDYNDQIMADWRRMAP